MAALCHEAHPFGPRLARPGGDGPEVDGVRVSLLGGGRHAEASGVEEQHPAPPWNDAPADEPEEARKRLGGVDGIPADGQPGQAGDERLEGLETDGGRVARLFTVSSPGGGWTASGPARPDDYDNVVGRGLRSRGAVLPMIHGTLTPTVTRLLVFVFVLVGSRWAEMRTGWPDYVVLPGSALAGLALLEALLMPRGHRLGAPGWAANLVVAVALGVLLFLGAG